jgi:hypothetical protein
MAEPLRAGVRRYTRRRCGVFTREQALTEYTPEEIHAYVAAPSPVDTATRLAAAQLVLSRREGRRPGGLPRDGGGRPGAGGRPQKYSDGS